MHQQTFAEVSFEQYRKPTRREQFLNEMNRVVPWAALVTVIEPVYPESRRAGASTGRDRTDAAPPLPATVVQPVGPSRGRGAVRLTCHAAVRGD